MRLGSDTEASSENMIRKAIDYNITLEFHGNQHLIACLLVFPLPKYAGPVMTA